MAGEQDVIAVFKADIEQFKAQMAELGVKIDAVDQKTESLGASTKKYTNATNTSAKSISTLSRGLGGITGLLGLTGRLFGVNTDKIEGFIFASQQFARASQQITSATKAQTVAQRLYTTVVGQSTGALAAFKVALAATGIGLAVIAITALINSFQKATAATEAKEKAAKKLREENNKLNESIRDVQKKEDELALVRATNSKQITEREAEELKARTKNIENVKNILAERKLIMNAEGKFELVEDDIIKKKLLTAERDYQTDLETIKEKFDKLDKDNRDKDAEKQREDAEKLRIQLLQEEADYFTKLNELRKKSITEGAEELKKLNKKAGEDVLKSFQEGIKDFGDVSDPEIVNQFGRTKAQQDKFDKDEEEKRLNRIEAEKEALDTIFKAQQEAFDKRQELLDKELDLQAENIETQRRLAENGLTNTLAFEEKRQAELQRQQQLEAQKQKRIKLLETFLNSLAEYSKTDPNTALQKALLQVALAQAATAVFAEDGGIIGEIGERSNLRRKHRGGGDVLLHAQTGEGIFSRKEMDNLGRRNFHLLKDAARFPIRDDVFAMPKLAVAGGMAVNNAELIKEVKGLRADIKNQKRETFELNKFGEYIKTSIENGVTEVTKGKLKKPRF